jgi:hypothetical protein
MVYMNTRSKTANQQLRELIAASGLTQREALARFNRGLGPAAYSESAWKSFLVDPATSRFRPLKPALLEHARLALAKKGKRR